MLRLIDFFSLGLYFHYQVCFFVKHKLVYYSALLVIILILGIVIQLFSSSVVASCGNKTGI